MDTGHTVAVLDIAPAAIDRAKRRLGDRASLVRWIVADVRTTDDVGTFGVWHDRATFHFLTSPVDRERYVRLLKQTVAVSGHAIIATFAPDGPQKCSGLEVVRYSGESLSRELGAGFALLKSVPETHLTPWGKAQSFQYAVLRRI